MDRSRHDDELIGVVVEHGGYRDIELRRPTRSWLWVFGVGAAAIVVVVGAMSRGSDRGGSSSSPTSVASTVPAVTTLVSGTTTPNQPSTSQPALSDPLTSRSDATTTTGSATSTTAPAAPGTIPTTVGPRQPLGVPSGAAVYLEDSGSSGPIGLVVYDIDTGVFHEVALGRTVYWCFRTVEGGRGLYLDCGTVMRVTAAGVEPVLADGPAPDYQVARFGRVAAGPQGRTWVRTLTDPPKLVLYDDAGRLTATAYELPGGSDLFGSTADGRPVVRGGDLRSFVINADGQRTLLAPGPTSVVEAGRFVETHCDDQQRCSFLGHVGDQTVPLGPIGPTRFRFQPGGTLIAVVHGDNATLSLLDAATGKEHQTALIVGVSSAPAGAQDALASNVAFLPGGDGVVVFSGTTIVILRLNGEIAASVVVPNAAGVGMIGVGKAGLNPVG